MKAFTSVRLGGSRRCIGLAAIVACGIAAPARADESQIKHGPDIHGSAVVGSTLTATAEWRPKRAEGTFTWLRCDASAAACAAVATGTDYAVRQADVGSRLRVRLVVTGPGGVAAKVSAPTAVVPGRPGSGPPSPPQPPAPPAPPQPPAPPAPPQPPTSPPTSPPQPPTSPPQPPTSPPPATSPAAPPAPTGTQPSAPAATPPTTTAGGVLSESSGRRLRFMRPRPVVRIRGWLTTNGARITLLTVRAPRGARVTVRCAPDCRRGRWARATSLVHAVPFERRLRAGTRLTVTVTKRGFVGKHTVITIRRGRSPARRDRCLYPGSARPSACRWH